MSISPAAGNWKRLTGHEIMGKTIGIVGLGRIGKEVAIRAKAFGMTVIGYDVYWDEAFAAESRKSPAPPASPRCFEKSDVISLHTNLTEETRDMVRAETIATMKDGVIILNCSRGEVVQHRRSRRRPRKRQGRRLRRRCARRGTAAGRIIRCSRPRTASSRRTSGRALMKACSARR